MKKKLNLGCGKDIRKDYLNVDFIKSKGVDLVYDLNKLPYPFKDNSFEEIIILSVLEHLDNAWDVINELYRIGKPNCIVQIVVPHFSSGNAWSNIQHKRLFSSTCFEQENILDKFEVIENVLAFVGFPRKSLKHRFANKFIGFYEYNLAYLFQGGDIRIKLRIIK